MKERRELRVILLVALVARLAAWLVSDGFVWPDEYFQSLEPAHHALYGHGVLAWEWQSGIRSWAVPYAYVAIFRVAAAFGFDGPGDLPAAAQLANVVLSLVVVGASWRLGRIAGRRTATMAGVLAAVFAPLLFHAGRTLTDCGAAVFTVAAYARFAESTREDDATAADRSALLAGVFIGLAYLFRYTAPIFFLGPAIYLYVHGQHRWLKRLALGFFAVVIALGLLDWLTWGTPFHSVLAYFSFNVAEGGSARYGVEPFGWYATSLAAQAGPLWLLAALLSGLAWVRKGPLGAIGLGLALGFVAMSLVAHKEERFLLPVVFMLPVAFAVGAERVAGFLRDVGRRRWLVVPALLAAVTASSWSEWARRDWRPGADWLAAMRWIGEAPDVHGVVTTTGWSNLGGDVVHRKNLPFVSNVDVGDEGRTTLLESPLLDTLVTDRAFRGDDFGFTEVVRFGEVIVMRRR